MCEFALKEEFRLVAVSALQNFQYQYDGILQKNDSGRLSLRISGFRDKGSQDRGHSEHRQVLRVDINI